MKGGEKMPDVIYLLLFAGLHLAWNVIYLTGLIIPMEKRSNRRPKLKDCNSGCDKANETYKHTNYALEPTTNLIALNMLAIWFYAWFAHAFG